MKFSKPLVPKTSFEIDKSIRAKMPLPSGVEIIHARFLYFVADLRVFLDGLSMQ